MQTTPIDAASRSGATLFGMTQDDLAGRGGLVTAREIAGQPALWRRLADLLEARSDELLAFLEEPFRERDLLVVFTGAGTSAYAGGVVAAEGMAATGREMRCVPTTDIVEGWSRHLKAERPTLLVSFARSGDSPESVAALEIVDRNGAKVWHLVVTCNPDGALARSAAAGGRRFSLVLPEGSCDLGFAMTGSFTGMVLAALSIFTLESPAAGAPLIRRLADAAEATLAAYPRIAEIAARRHERVVFLGSGPLREAAAEAALKLLELTDGEVVALSFSPLAFRHGPKTIVNGPKTLVVQLVSGDPAVQPYGVDMVAELAREGRAEVLALVPEEARPGVASPAFAALGHAATGGTPLPGDGWLAVSYVVFAQVFALLSSLDRGFATDTPSRSGEVNRVVKNVAIYG